MVMSGELTPEVLQTTVSITLVSGSGSTGAMERETGGRGAPLSIPSVAMSTDRLSRRVGAIAPSATLAVSAKAKALRAAGESVIGFGAGEPNFATPDHIVEAAVAACRDPKNHKYTAVGGLLELKKRSRPRPNATRDSTSMPHRCW